MGGDDVRKSFVLPALSGLWVQRDEADVGLGTEWSAASSGGGWGGRREREHTSPGAPRRSASGPGRSDSGGPGSTPWVDSATSVHAALRGLSGSGFGPRRGQYCRRLILLISVGWLPPYVFRRAPASL